MFDLHVYPFPINDTLSAPGFLASSPAGKPVRGRENNLLLIYFSLSGQTALSGERLQSWMESKAQLYFHNAGTVTAGLREFAEAINADLFERNTRHSKPEEQVTLSLQAAVLRNEMITLINCGNGSSFFVGNSESTQVRDTEATSRGLGLSQTITLRFTQFTVAENDLLLLAFNSPETWTIDLMSGGQNLAIEPFARRLFSQSGISKSSGVLVRFSGGSGKVEYANMATAKQAPVQAAAGETTPSTEKPSGRPARPAPISAQYSPAENVQTPGPQPAPSSFTNKWQPDEENEDQEQKPGSAQSDAIKSVVGKALRGGAKASHHAGDWFKAFLEKISPNMPEQLQGFSKKVLIFIAVAVPVIIVIIATSLYIHKGQNNLFDQYLAQAQQVAQKAVTEAGDNPSQLASYQESLYWLDKADSYGKSPDSIALRNQVQAGIDNLEGITRVDMMSALGDAIPGANFTQLAANETDLYALDSISGKVLRFTLSGSSYVQDTKFDCGPNPQNPLNAIDALVDMVILSPDNSYNATLLAVDAKGTLDYCVPGNTGYIVKLPNPDMGWNSIKSISYSDGNLYVLDPGGNMVYRFSGNGVDFTDAPSLFFDAEIPTLSDAIDIEVNGFELYVLRSNGQMAKCTYSSLKDMKSTQCQEPAPFLDTRSGQSASVDNFPDAQFVQMRMTSAPDSSLYLLDGSKDTVYHFSYQRNLQNILHPRMLDGSDSAIMVPTALAVSESRELFIAYANNIYFGQLP